MYTVKIGKSKSMKKVDNNLSKSYEIVKVFIQKLDNLMKRKKTLFRCITEKRDFGMSKQWK